MHAGFATASLELSPHCCACSLSRCLAAPFQRRLFLLPVVSGSARCGQHKSFAKCRQPVRVSAARAVEKFQKAVFPKRLHASYLAGRLNWQAPVVAQPNVFRCVSSCGVRNCQTSERSKKAAGRHHQSIGRCCLQVYAQNTFIFEVFKCQPVSKIKRFS